MDDSDTILENELLGYYFSQAGNDPVQIQDLLGADACDKLRQALAEELVEQAGRSDADLVEYQITPLSSGAHFHSILYRQGGYGGQRKIILFGFRDMFNASALPLLGLVIAAATGTLGFASVPVAGAVVKAAWSQLEVLREPEDRNAIELLQALSTAAVRARAERGERHPSWAEILEAVPLSPEQALAALKELKARSIVEVGEWGDQAGDIENEHNRWRIRL